MNPSVGDSGALDPLRELMDREQAGEPVDDQEFLRRHFDHGESLRRRLNAWRGIQAAERRARADVADLSPDLKAGLSEDLGIIQAALPGYEVVGCVQHGGQGIVYEARQHSTNRRVAIKLLLDGPLANDRQRLRFEREVELIARLDHPNIVTVFEGGAARGRLYYTMSYVEGLPIDDYAIMADLTPHQIVALLIQLARAMSYAHQNGVIHRDLKPDNLLVDQAGKPYIMDFGLAEDLWSSDHQHSITAPGQFLGTLPYMSPEQLGGQDGRVDIRSDVYALGVCLFKLLTDTLPFDRGAPEQLRQRILNDESASIRRVIRERQLQIREPHTINADLEAIVTKALAKNKNQRYPSADALADDLERYLRGEAVSARSDNRLYVLRRMVRKYWLPVSIAAVILVSVIGSAVSIAVSSRQTARERDRALAASSAALTAFRTTLDSVETTMRRMAGGSMISAQTLAALDEQLPILTKLIEHEPAFSAVRVSIQEKIGDLARYRGQSSEARAAYESALQDCRAIDRHDEDSVEHLLREARLCRKLLPISDDARSLFDTALVSCTRALSHRPLASSQLELAELFDAVGEWEASRGRLAYALEYYRESVIWADFADASSSSVGAASVAARALRHEAEVGPKLGLGGPALPLLLRSMQLEEQSILNDPSDLAERSRFIDARIRLAVALRNGSNPSEAEHQLRIAVHDAETLAEVDPAPVDWQLNVFRSKYELTMLMLEQLRCGDAELLIGDVLAHLDDARKRAPDNPSLKQCLVDALLAQGWLFLEEQNLPRARATMELTRNMRMEHASMTGDSIARQALANSMDHLAIAVKRCGEYDAAISERNHSLNLLRRLRIEEPRNVEFERMYYVQLINQAAALSERADDPQLDLARASLEEAGLGLAQMLHSDRGVGWEARIQSYLATAEKNLRIVIQKSRKSKQLEALRH